MNTTKEINLTGIMGVISKWKKPIAFFVLIVTVLTVIISVFILPKEYYAGTTVLPVNSMLTDKSRIFSDNIRELYSIYGTSDDLDRIYTVAKAGNVLGFVVDSLKLPEHYSLELAGEKARTKAVTILKKHVDITKTENGALQVDVWDKDPSTAANIANTIIYKTEMLGNDMLQQANQQIIDKLREDIVLKKDKTKHDTIFDRQIVQQVDRDEKIIDEFNLATTVKQPSLLILEKAYPSLRPDKPNHWLIISAAFILSLFFSILAALIVDRTKAT